MIRWQIRHDRDPLVLSGFHWNLFQLDTDDPHAKPIFMGFGSWATCADFAFALADLRRKTGIRP